MKAVTVHDIIKLYLKHARSLVGLSGFSLLVAVLVYNLFIPYLSVGSILTHDSQNSGIQSFVQSFTGLNKSLQDGRRGNTQLAKQLEYLKSQQFLNKVGERFAAYIESNQVEPLNREKIKELVRTNQLSIFLRNSLRINLTSDFEIEVRAKDKNSELSFLISEAATYAMLEQLKSKERDDLNKIQKFIDEQIQKTDSSLKSLSGQMAKHQNSQDAILPLASQERLSEYISELLVREEELKLKVSENLRMIQMLNKGRTAARESKLYGVGGRIESLRVENSALTAKLSQIQAAMLKLKNQTSSLPYERQMFEDLKKKSDLEFAKYKDLVEAKAKVEAQTLSLDSRFEILKVPSLFETRPIISLWSLIGLMLVGSLVVGSLGIYIRYLWRYEEVIAQASRDVMFFENHPMDPRVIIENSKIKFSLNKLGIDEKEESTSSQVGSKS